LDNKVSDNIDARCNHEVQVIYISKSMKRLNSVSVVLDRTIILLYATYLIYSSTESYLHYFLLLSSLTKKQP